MAIRMAVPQAVRKVEQEAPAVARAPVAGRAVARRVTRVMDIPAAPADITPTTATATVIRTPGRVRPAILELARMGAAQATQVAAEPAARVRVTMAMVRR